MTDAEKLQKLIELARNNGWEFMQHLNRGLDRSDIETLLTGDIYDGNAIGVKEPVNSILFDHDFIKALCQVKYGEQVNNPKDSKAFPFRAQPYDRRNDLAWHAVLTNLAISKSENRIDYLYEVFING
jgi:hypothetical protein